MEVARVHLHQPWPPALNGYMQLQMVLSWLSFTIGSLYPYHCVSLKGSRLLPQSEDRTSMRVTPDAALCIIICHTIAFLRSVCSVITHIVVVRYDSAHTSCGIFDGSACRICLFDFLPRQNKLASFRLSAQHQHWCTVGAFAATSPLTYWRASASRESSKQTYRYVTCENR